VRENASFFSFSLFPFSPFSPFSKAEVVSEQGGKGLLVGQGVSVIVGSASQSSVVVIGRVI
jgi:hypothetical protein